MRRGVWKRLTARPFTLCIVIFFAAASSSVLPNIPNLPAAGSQIVPRRGEYAPGQLIVKLQGSLRNEVLERHRLTVQEDFSPNFSQVTTFSAASAQEHLYLLEADQSADMEALAAAIEAEEGVVYAEPNYRYEFQVKPNDPLYEAPYWTDGQWPLQRSGFEQVWAEKSKTDTVVINLDTGIDLSHPDLAPNIWKNEREASGRAGVDDDGNGYTDDVYGWNFVDNTNDVQDRDAVSHGTKTAGMGARGNNAMGIAGASWQCQIMSLKIARDVVTFTGDIVKAVQYAKTTLSLQGKRGVFNGSFTSNGRSQALADAIRESGMLFVAATGNHGIDDPTGVYYPAAFNREMDNALSATATTYDDDDRLMNGASWVGSDIGAPGSWVLTTEVGGGYTRTGGTSMASPHVAHALAIIQDIEPDPLKAKARVLKSADIVPALQGKVKTGRLNVERAFHGRYNPNRAPTISIQTLAYKGMEGTPLPMTAITSDPDGDPLNVTWRFSDGQSDSGNLIALVFPLGNYWGAVTVSDGIAETMLTFTIQITDRIEVRPKVKGAKKLTLTVTSSRQNQNPRPKIVIRELNQEIPYDEASRAYKIVFNIKKNAIPSPLTIESELGGSFTLSWR